MTSRRTSTSNVGPAPASSRVQVRTAAATAERRRRYVRALLEKFMWTVGELTDEQLVTTILALGEEFETRRAAADSAAACGIRHACAESEADEDEKGTHTVRTPGGDRTA